MLSAKEFSTILLGLGIVLISATLAQEQKQNVNSRIVGGTTTTVGRYPHMVHLTFYGVPVCGGSLVSPKWVVTAAHCVNFRASAPNRFQVRGGTSSLTGGAGVTRKVQKIIVHSKYNSKIFDYDVAMLKLSAPMTGNNIKPIQLSAAGVPNGATVTVNGWGITALGPTNQLRTVQLKKISQAACKKRYPQLTANMLCADEPGKGKCLGDSGSGMIYKNRLVGLVSWGAGCGSKRSPGVYTNLFKLKPFIINAIQKK